MSKKYGKVYLIGGGPGDPGLITVKGKEILGKADAVVHDYLVNPELLSHTKPGAELICVGKKAGHKVMPQGRINELLVEKARGGGIVARLKGGDPFIFGRGGEEAEALAAEGIEFEIVPGVTSAAAVPAYAGIPLTHRKIASSFAVVTGHENPAKGESGIEWDIVARMGTVVFLMGVTNLAENMQKLIDSGMSPDTPAAVISRGTYPSQTSVTGTVGDIAGKAAAREDISSPAIVVTGEVVGLSDVISWYEKKPLFGKRIVVTRPREQARPLSSLFEEMGAEVVEFPAIEIAPPRSYAALDRAMGGLGSYDWIIFTSVNGVRGFFERLRLLGRDVREMHGAKIAAIGEVTADELGARGINADMVPGDYRAEGLIELFHGMDVRGKRVLIPRAREAREILPESLREMGAEVDIVPVYETKKPGKVKTAALRKDISEGRIDVITFTSSSTVRNFLETVGEIKAMDGKPVLACIGPVTEKTLADLGYDAGIVPAEYTAAGLAESVADYFKNRK